MSTETAHIDQFVIDGLPPIGQWPEIILDDPLFDYPDRLNAATELLDSAVERGWGARPCMGLGDELWTYDDMLKTANQIAAVLVEDHGLVPGNRVLIRGANAPWVVAAWYAILKAGAVAVVTMPMLREPELRKIYDKCDPTIALCSVGMQEPLGVFVDTPVALWGEGGDLTNAAANKSGSFSNVDTAATDPALLGFTSGTTGEPKATIHFHRDLLVIADSFQPILKATGDDIFVGSPPLAFTFGLGGEVVFPMRVGASNWFSERPGPAALAELIEQRKATVCFTAPTAYRAMLGLDPRPDLSSLRRGVSAGETLPVSTFDYVETETGVRLIDGLGATELLHIFVSAADDDIRPGATGKPIPGWQATILDDEGNESPPGEIGRLAVKGPIGCRYLDDDRQEVYVQDGWNITGDAYKRDDDGYLWYQARADDMIISSGYNIAAPDVEAGLLSHPSVAEAGVIGDPDPDRGMIVHAFLHLKDPSQASEELERKIQNHVKQTIAPYKYPRRITFCPDPLPKTNTGKLQRNKLGK
ncbi:MAG: AMP-binding protein [Acidimicrobiales bacterium]